MLISAHDFIQMWMNVWKKVTSVTRMLIVQTLMAHILVNVISATVEMDSIVEVRPLNRNYTIIQLSVKKIINNRESCVT